MKRKFIILGLLLCSVTLGLRAQNNIIEEVAWVIGDKPIYKSEIEESYLEAQQDRTPIKGDPYCVIPEMIAMERLFLHQADLDTVEVSEVMIQQQVEAQLNYLIANLGSKEKVEQYFRKAFPEIREYYLNSMRNRFKVQQVKSNLTKNVKITPTDVRKYFATLPQDSLPYVPQQVEVQAIRVYPRIPREEIDNIKARLRDFADRVNKGEAEFSTLAILYSEGPEGIRGGETGFVGRGKLDPQYAAVAFNLNDPKKVSKIVETEYGFHIIQLIEKRGERINTRNILLRPKVAEKDLMDAVNNLDSLRAEIFDKKKVTFDEAVQYVSQDKDTRLNRGVMVNEETGSSRFQLSELPAEIAKAVSNLEEGGISKAFVMKDPKRDREIVCMVKLTKRIPAHTANLSDDFQLIKEMYENKVKEDIIADWLKSKINETYVRIEDGWRGCEFENEGWIKAEKDAAAN